MKFTLIYEGSKSEDSMNFSIILLSRKYQILVLVWYFLTSPHSKASL